MDYAKRLRDLREEINATQKDVADVLGTTEEEYAPYEQNADDLPNEYLIKLANFYHVSADYMLGITEKRERLS